MLSMASPIRPSEDKPTKAMWCIGPDSLVTIDAQSSIEAIIFQSTLESNIEVLALSHATTTLPFASMCSSAALLESFTITYRTL